jgi:hypothetical protein
MRELPEGQEKSSSTSIFLFTIVSKDFESLKVGHWSFVTLYFVTSAVFGYNIWKWGNSVQYISQVLGDSFNQRNYLCRLNVAVPRNASPIGASDSKVM